MVDHPGFNAAGSGGILDSFPGADFTQDGYMVMTLTVTGEKVEEVTMTSGSFARVGVKFTVVTCLSTLISFLV